MDPIIRDVADTAYMVAAVRAQESERPDALFKDPLAGRLAGERGKAMMTSMPRGFIMSWNVVMRTALIDGMIEAAVAAGADTVLNLGAGLDTRPYRMNLPASLRWLEVDRDHVLEDKRAALSGEQPRCRLEYVALDVTDGAALQKLLDDVAATSKQAVVLTEGVVPYLTTDEAGALADRLRACKPIDGWIIDYFSADLLRWRARSSGQGGQLENAPFKFSPADWKGFFAEHGWNVAELQYLADIGRKVGRPSPFPPLMLMLMRLRLLFTSPRRRADLRKMVGYARLEPGAPA